MAIQALRNAVGEKDFFAILKGWPKQHAYGNASVSDFIGYAERVSGERLGGLFDTWLYQPSKPAASAVSDGSRAAQPKSWKRIVATNGVHSER